MVRVAILQVGVHRQAINTPGLRAHPGAAGRRGV